MLSVASSLTLLLLVVLTLPASAQQVWAPVIIGEEGLHDTVAAVHRLRVELGAHSSDQLLKPSEAAVAVEKTHSRPFVPVSEQTASEMRKQLSAGMSAAALADWAEAEKALGAFLQSPREQRETLLSTRLGRDILDLCLMVAGEKWRTGSQSESRSIAATCTAGLPKQAERRTSVGTNGRAVLEALQASNAGTKTLTISVEHSSTACTAHVNGLDVGRTPATVAGLAAGTTWDVWLDCGDRVTRVHPVRIEAETQKLSISPRQDRTVRTGGAVVLEYPSMAASRNFRVADAIAVAKATGASRALLVDALNRKVLRFALIDVATGDRLGWSEIERPIGPATMEGVAGALTSGRGRTDVGELTAIAHGAGPVPPEASVTTLELVLGLGLAGAGTAASVMSWAYADLQGQYSTWAKSDERYAGRAVANGKNAATWALVGTGLRFIAVPMLLPEFEDAPAVPWVAAGAGITLGATGVILASSRSSCVWECREPGADQTGALVILQALPFLAIPATYLLRAALKNEEVSVEAASDGRTTTRVTLVGRF